MRECRQGVTGSKRDECLCVFAPPYVCAHMCVCVQVYLCTCVWYLQTLFHFKVVFHKDFRRTHTCTDLSLFTERTASQPGEIKSIAVKFSRTLTIKDKIWLKAAVSSLIYSFSPTVRLASSISGLPAVSRLQTVLELEYIWLHPLCY